MRVEIDPHCQRRMRERGISPEDMAIAWTAYEKDMASQDHPTARVRTGRRPDGSAVTVVAEVRGGCLYFWTTW
ncbi:MAG: hypothetical protein NVSMB29_19360 [Candidatus Dormibacteria bacterium]